MADVSHELGSLRFVVDSPLSSKVAMFNNQANQHKQSQLLNPFSNSDGRVSPKPQFSKEEYGKPLAGSLTEMRGQKANIHVMREMLELCQIINSEGYNVKNEPQMRVIPFGELFNIYNYISDKVVGILLRARKYKLVEFEGEMLFQRRDDDVPVFLLKPIKEIRQQLEQKIEEIKRATSPAPQATSVLLDKKTHTKTKKESDISPASSAATSRAPTPSVLVTDAPSNLTDDCSKEAETISGAASNQIETNLETPCETVASTTVQHTLPQLNNSESSTVAEQPTTHQSESAAITSDHEVVPQIDTALLESQATETIQEQDTSTDSIPTIATNVEIDSNNISTEKSRAEPPTVVIEAPEEDALITAPEGVVDSSIEEKTP